MGCTPLSNSWPTGCDKVSSGIQKVWLASKSTISSIAPALNSTGSPSDDGLITAINMTGSPADIFYDFTPDKFTADFTETSSGGELMIPISYKPQLVLNYTKNEATKRNTVKLLAESMTVAIVKMYNGTYFIVGEENGLDLSGANSASGKTMSEFHGWTLTLTGLESVPAREIEESAVLAVI